MKPVHLMTDLEIQEDFVRRFQHAYRIEIGEPPYKFSSEFFITINGVRCPVGIFRHDREADQYDTRAVDAAEAHITEQGL